MPDPSAIGAAIGAALAAAVASFAAGRQSKKLPERARAHEPTAEEQLADLKDRVLALEAWRDGLAREVAGIPDRESSPRSRRSDRA